MQQEGSLIYILRSKTFEKNLNKFSAYIVESFEYIVCMYVQVKCGKSENVVIESAALSHSARHRLYSI